MAAGWRIKEFDAMPRNDTDHSHFPRRKTTASRIHLLGIACGDDAVVHNDHHSLAPCIVGRSNANRSQQIDRTVRTNAGRRPLSSDNYHRLLRLHGEVEKKSSLFEAIGAVRHDDSRNIRTLFESGVDVSSKLQPL